MAMENPVITQFIGKVAAFKTDENGDEVCSDFGLFEVTDAGDGFAEVAFNYGDERVYLGFRVSDLIRAIKEATP
jgi:hypothetical protein